jgi:hypothetical protein
VAKEGKSRQVKVRWTCKNRSCENYGVSETIPLPPAQIGAAEERDGVSIFVVDYQVRCSLCLNFSTQETII